MKRSLYLSLACTGTWAGWVHFASAFCALCIFAFYPFCLLFFVSMLGKRKMIPPPKSFFLCSVGKRSILTNYA